MKRTYEYTVDYSTAFLSALDITGSLVISNFEQPLKGIHHDMDQLTNDLTVLESDYLKAIEKLSRNEEINNERSEN